MNLCIIQVQYFEQAIEIDPNYAPAHAGLAFSYRALSSIYMHPQEVMPKAKDAALRALELDETLSEAHTSLGFTRLFYDWDWPGAERAFKRALDLNPSSAEAHNWYRAYLTAMGRHEEAIAEARQALRLDPFSLGVQAESLWSLFLARRYDEVIEQAGKALDMEPSFAFGYGDRGLAYAARGEFPQAIADLQTATQLDDSPILALFLAYGYAVSGQRYEAGKLLDEIKELSKRRYVCPYEIAAVYVGLGEDDQAFEWFQQAVRDRSDCVPWLSVDPRFDRIRSDPRFTELLEQVGLVPRVSPRRIKRRLSPAELGVE